MVEPLIVRVVTAPSASGHYSLALWGVVTADPRTAIEAVKARVPDGRTVEVTGGVLSPYTVSRLGLLPGQAWPL